METLIRFIEKVENRVLYYVTEYTEHQDKMDYFTGLWVHQLNGRVIFNDSPTKSHYKRIAVGDLCTIDNNLRQIPDKKAIKRWVEGEVLMHSLK